MKKLLLLFALLAGLQVVAALPLCPSLLWGDEAFHRPYFDLGSRPRIKILSGVQNSLSDWEKVDEIKRAMREGTYRFESEEGRIGGHYYEPSQIYFVGEGHHRIAAALELAKESGDWSPFAKLINLGTWEKTEKLPRHRYSLPQRTNWGNFLGWRSFLKPFHP